MNKSLLTIMLVCCLTLISCDNQSNEEMQPPEPILTVEGKNVLYEKGTYSWSSDNKAVNADTPAPSTLVEQTESNEISSDAELTINFEYKPSELKGGIWENEKVEYTPITDNQVTLPDRNDNYVYVLHASWEEGDAIYAVPFNPE